MRKIIKLTQKICKRGTEEDRWYSSHAIDDEGYEYDIFWGKDFNDVYVEDERGRDATNSTIIEF